MCFAGSPPAMMFWGQQYNSPAAAFWARNKTIRYSGDYITIPNWGGYAEALMYFSPLGSASDVDALPPFKLYSQRNLGIFRTQWESTPGNYLSFKGGNNSWNHAHLDLGTFVYDLQGIRVVDDLASDNYGLPGYFGPQRWSYYRLNNRGHNTLLVNNVTQIVDAGAVISTFNVSNGAAGVDAFSIVSLSKAYTAPVTSFNRGFASFNNVSLVVISDEITTSSAVPLVWSMHTYLNITVDVDGQGALLYIPGTSFSARLQIFPSSTACVGAIITYVSVDLLAPQDPSTGLFRIDISASTQGCTRITVGLGANVPADMKLQPLKLWPTTGPV
jgi:hypothetical protein